MKLARLTQVESLTFIKGKPIDCTECPIKGREKFCADFEDFAGLFDRDTAELACYGAFMRFLLSDED
jgi:hypothetical protein